MAQGKNNQVATLSPAVECPAKMIGVYGTLVCVIVNTLHDISPYKCRNALNNVALKLMRLHRHIILIN